MNDDDYDDGYPLANDDDELLRELRPSWSRDKHGYWLLDVEDILDQLNLGYRMTSLDALSIIGYTSLVDVDNRVSYAVHVNYGQWRYCMSSEVAVLMCMQSLMAWLHENFLI